MGALDNKDWEWIWTEMQKASIWRLPAVDTGMKEGMEYGLEPDVEWKMEWDGTEWKNGIERQVQINI